MNRFFKKAVVDLSGYISPPQDELQAKLNQNESPFDIPLEIKNELLEDFGKLAWNRYPVNESPVLKEKLAKLHNVKPEQVLLGNGSNQLFQTLLTATLEAGDKVFYCPPTFSLFDLYVPIYGGQALELPIGPGEQFPVDEIIRTLNEEKPKVALLCSPNNPTGAEIPREDIERILQSYSGLIFLDEAYGEFSSWSAIKDIDKYENLIISRTFSKAYSMAGLRFGYFIAQAQLINQFRKVNLPYNVNLLTEAVVSRLIDNDDIMKKQVEFLKFERDRVYSELLKLDSIKVFPSQANFLLIKFPDSKKVFKELKELGVLVRDVSGYHLLENHLRVNVGSKEENDLFIESLKKVLKED